ncbi:MAG: CPBP family intramembrane metalloprotease [Actinobacteria bacterium]|nr:CPBP family intramembrane metalloprotease [Actinomycetota bacterium]
MVWSEVYAQAILRALAYPDGLFGREHDLCRAEPAANTEFNPGTCRFFNHHQSPSRPAGLAGFYFSACLDFALSGSSLAGSLLSQPRSHQHRALAQRGLGLPIAIGIPGIALYVLAVQLGLTARVIPSSLGDYWWTPLILFLAALRAGLQEEVIAVAFLAKKLELIRPGLTIAAVVLISSLFRASYHLYQGFSAFIGNFLMGLVFAYLFLRGGRVASLVIAHTTMNTAVFIGYPLVAPYLPI